MTAPATARLRTSRGEYQLGDLLTQAPDSAVVQTSGGEYRVDGLIAADQTVIIETNMGRYHLSDALNFVDFFVDPAGNDSNSGATPATAFKTLSKLQSVMTANKSAALKRGGRWREGFTAPAAGIKLSGYGAPETTELVGTRYDYTSLTNVPYYYITNAPIIDGSDLFNPTWTAYDGSVADDWFSDAFTDTVNTGLASHVPTVIGDAWIRHANYSSGGLIISSDNMARRDNSTSQVAYYVNPGPGLGDCAVEAVVKAKSIIANDRVDVLGRMGGSRTEVSAYSATLSSAGVVSVVKSVANVGTTIGSTGSITLNAGDTVTVRLEVSGDINVGGTVTINAYVGGVLKASATDTAGAAFIENPGRVGLRLGAPGLSVGADATGIQCDSFKVVPLTPGTAVNTYKATTTTPRLLIFKGNYSRPGAGQNLLADGEWYYRAGVLYLRSNAGIPLAGETARATRTNGIDLASRSNITLTGIAVEGTVDNAVDATSTTNAHLDRVMIQKSCGDFLFGDDIGSHGAIDVTLATDPLIENCVLRDVQTDAIYGGTPVRPIIRDTWIERVWGWGSDGIQFDCAAASIPTNHSNSLVQRCVVDKRVSDAIKGCYIAFGGGHTVKDSVFLGGAFGTYLLGPTPTAQRNFYALQKHKLGGACAVADSFTPGFDIADALITHNIMFDCTRGVWTWTSDTHKRTNMRVYHNTVVNVNNVPVAQAHFGYDGGQGAVNCQVNGEFKNNILWNASGGGQSLVFTDRALGAVWNQNNNLIGPEATGFVSYKAVSSDTLSAVAVATANLSDTLQTAQEISSFAADPLFVSLGALLPTGYALLPTSPALEIAEPITGINDGFTAPDLGALEATAVTTLAVTNLAPPVVTSTVADPATGNVASCSPGVWSRTRSPSPTYQWTRNNVAIVGSTGSTYTFVPADSTKLIRCQVTVAGVTATSNAITSHDPYVLDSFTDTGGVALTSHVPETGTTWTKHASYAAGSTAQITGDNRLRSNSTSATGVGVYYCATSPAQTNGSVEADVTMLGVAAGGQAGVVGWLDPASDTYLMANYSNAVGFRVFKLVAGVATQVGSTYADVLVNGNSRHILLRKIGTTVTGWVDGVQRVSGTVSDVAFDTPGRAGIRLVGTTTPASNGFWLDNLLAKEIT